MMRTVTIEQVMAWCPCGYDKEDDGKNYTVGKVTELFAGKKTLSAVDVAALGIPQEDRVWILLHPEFFADEQLHTLACDFAEHVLYLCNDDPRLAAAIAAKRRWLRGEITDEELDAASVAAWNVAKTATRGAAETAARAVTEATTRAIAEVTTRAVARTAARAATRAAARDAIGDAAWAAAWTVAWAAAGEWQIERILKMGGNDDTGE